MRHRGFALRHTATGLITGAVAIAVVSGLIAALKQFADPLGLTGLYLFAILPVAIGWGFVIAGVVAVASLLTFAFFFSPPLHSFHIAESDTAAALVIALVTAYVVSELARRAHERAREARLRAHEAEQAQTELGGLADEQAALRRVATLVAQAVPTTEVLEAVTREVGLRCDAELARMERRVARSPRSPHGAGVARLNWPSALGSLWRARASPRRCTRPAGRPAWTASRARRGRSHVRLRRWASAPRSAARSWSAGGLGE
jgi:Domain of unknown function (DUF4118)